MHSRKKLPSSQSGQSQNGSLLSGGGRSLQSTPRVSLNAPNGGSFENGRGADSHNSGGPSRNGREYRAFKQQIEARFREFLAGDEEELRLDPMPNDLRKQAHIVARRLDLRSTSYGKEPHRYMTVKRIGYRQQTSADYNDGSAYFDSDPIRLSETQQKLIRDFMAEHPIEELDIKIHVGAEDEGDGEEKKGRRNAQKGARASTWGQTSQDTVPRPPRLDGHMERFRRSLPTHAYRQQILDTIESYRVTVITGGTGCGKSTQVPQFLLEQASEEGRPLRIVCTQPRRLPALAVAKRVAAERGERLGGTVGYHIRLEQRTSAETLLTYCTSGVLLRQLSVDPVASEVSHIILDEIHEREQCTDYLLIVLREALRKRPDLRLILMSATMEGQLELFRKYFGARSTGFVDVPSRLHHVEKFSLEEVLAMTGYMPTSIGLFGGQFDPSEATSAGTWGNGGFGFISSEPPPPAAERAPNPFGSFGNAGFSSPPSNAAQNSGDSSRNFRSSVNRSNLVGTLERLMGSDRPTHFTEAIGRKVKQLGDRLEADAVVECYTTNKNQLWEGVDQDLLVELIKYLMDSPVDGALLVFLPGYDDIMKAKDSLNHSSFACACRRRPIIYTLHSQMNTNDQQRIFDPVSKEQSHHYRKVILSTNIAEASLTIDDVVFVIDSGKSKEQSYDHETRVNQLRCGWVAKSNAEQRAGRAGRVRDGYCFRLFSTRDYERMLSTQVPEMRRIAIHDICLNAKMFAPGIQNAFGRNLTVVEFLARAPDPPPEDSVKMSLEFLEQLGALYRPPPRRGSAEEEGVKEPEMTDLGRLIAHLPLEPQLARMLLFGLVLRCFNPIVTLVAALSYQDRAFSLPMAGKEGNERQLALGARDEFAQRDLSDHLMFIRAYNAFAQAEGDQRHYCQQHFLNPTVMYMIQGIRRQLVWELKRLSLLPSDLMDADDPTVNQFGHSWPMVQCAVVAGCYPGIGFVKYGQKWKKIRTNVEKQLAGLHPASALKRQVANGLAGASIEYLAYHELSRIDEGLTLKTVTAVPPITVALFAGPIRMAPYVMDNFELGEEDLPVDALKLDEWQDKQRRSKPYEENSNYEGEEADGEELAWMDQQIAMEISRYEGRLKADMDYTVEFESWLAFHGHYNHMQSLVRLRFKLMQYFLYRLRCPLDRVEDEEMKLLSCLDAVLGEEHKKCGFPECTDLNGQERTESTGGRNDVARNAPPDHRPGRFNPIRDGRSTGYADGGRYQQPQRDRYGGQQSSRWGNSDNRGSGGGDYQNSEGGARSHYGGGSRGSWRQ